MLAAVLAAGLAAVGAGVGAESQPPAGDAHVEGVVEGSASGLKVWIASLVAASDCDVECVWQYRRACGWRRHRPGPPRG